MKIYGIPVKFTSDDGKMIVFKVKELSFTNPEHHEEICEVLKTVKLRHWYTDWVCDKGKG